MRSRHAIAARRRIRRHRRHQAARRWRIAGALASFAISAALLACGSARGAA